jgi:hypothetical protein
MVEELRMERLIGSSHYGMQQIGGAGNITTHIPGIHNPVGIANPNSCAIIEITIVNMKPAA